MPHFTKDQHDRVYRTDRPGPTAPAATDVTEAPTTAAPAGGAAEEAAPDASAGEA